VLRTSPDIDSQQARSEQARSEQASSQQARSQQVSSDLQVALARVVRRLRQGHMPGDLTLSEWSVLARLDRGGPAGSGELAADERVRPQAMCATLAALEKRDLVIRTADPHDGRRAVISLADTGRQMLADRRSAKGERMGRALATFTESELRKLADAAELLDRLANLL
jgi:DNA-binding MarR family transcriptional regulator